jgi:flagellar biosynthesis/type III secretory pathway chaperone
MSDEYTRLAEVIDDLISSHTALLELEQEKQQLIVDQNWVDLQKRVERSRELLGHIEAGERTRREIIGALDLDPASTLTQVIAGIPAGFGGNQGRELAARGGQLRAVMGKLRELNRQSARMLGSSLDVIDFTLSLISGSRAQGKTYSGNGRESAAGGRKTSLVFDYKV